MRPLTDPLEEKVAQKNSAAPYVCTVVLNWNGKSDTIECLRSLQGITCPNHTVLVVDNNSSDGSATAITELFPEIPLIKTNKNLGFAGGNNVGIRRALDMGVEFIFLLNNDTTVAPDLITQFVEAATNFPSAGILGPKIYYYSDPRRLWSAGGRWLPDRQHFDQRGDGEIDQGQYDGIAPSDFTVGCAMFIRRQVFEKVGLLDEEYFLNYEEIDFSTRARRVGFTDLYVPKARVWHKVSVSFGGEDSPLKTYFTFRNRLLWAHKRLPIPRRLILHWSIYRRAFERFLSPTISAIPQGPRKALWALRGSISSPLNRAWLMGIRDYWKKSFGECPDDVWKLQRRWKEMRGQAGTKKSSAPSP